MITLLPSSSAAAADDIQVYTERLKGTKIGITIEFPTEISGSFAGTMNGKHFDCETIPPNMLYCIGRYAYWVDPATLFIYTQSVPHNIVMEQVIAVPPNNGEPDLPPPAPSEECSECEQQLQVD